MAANWSTDNYDTNDQSILYCAYTILMAYHGRVMTMVFIYKSIRFF
jgi:hypothetical protein